MGLKCERFLQNFEIIALYFKVSGTDTTCDLYSQGLSHV